MALDLNDKSGNGNTLTNNGSTGGATEGASTPFAASTVSADLELSNSDYLNAADSTSLSITSDITIECWVNLEAHVAVGDFAFMVSKWDDGGERSYFFRYRRNSLTVFQWQFGYYDGTADRLCTLAMSAAPSTTVWRHWAVIFDAATSTAEFVLNGVSQGTNAATGTTINDSTADLLIGAWKSGGTVGKFIDGMLDEIRIWNGKRTVTQILDNYQLELVGNETNL